MNHRFLGARLCALAIACGLACTPALADDRAGLEQLRATTLALIEALVSQGLLSRERADSLLRQAERPAAVTAAPAGSAPNAATAAETPKAPEWGNPPAAAPRSVIRVPYVSETLRAQIREEIKNDVLSQARAERWADPRLLPDWLPGVTIEGDVRVRWQADRFDAPVYLLDTGGNVVGGVCDIVGGNLPAPCFRAQTVAGTSPAWAPDLSNTGTDRNRLTLRVRLGINAKVTDKTSLGLRLSTGSTSGPTSSSQTLGTQLNKASVVLDRAFVRWQPRPELRLVAGRLANPFFSSDLTWPDDLSFDGLALQAERNLVPGVKAFATLGAFPLEEFSLSKRDKWLYAMQLGAEGAWGAKAQWRLGLAVYDFNRIEGEREQALPPAEPRAGAVPYLTSQYPATVRAKGNTLINLNAPDSTAAATWGLASKFRPVNLTATLTLRNFDPFELSLGLDWLRNTGFDLADIRARAGLPALDGLLAKTGGVQAKVQFGKPRLTDRGDWQLAAALRRFERDAWVDGFTDTTWHLGGTNYQGWQIGGQYAFDRRSVVGLRVTSTRNLDDGVRTLLGTPAVPVGNLSSAPLKIDVWQIDFSTRF
jgi:Putative porin